jgi:hypothetical protein
MLRLRYIYSKAILLLAFYFCLQTRIAFAESKQIDSLKTLLNFPKEDTVIAQRFIKLSYFFVEKSTDRQNGNTGLCRYDGKTFTNFSE